MFSARSSKVGHLASLLKPVRHKNFVYKHIFSLIQTDFSFFLSHKTFACVLSRMEREAKIFEDFLMKGRKQSASAAPCGCFLHDINTLTVQSNFIYRKILDFDANRRFPILFDVAALNEREITLRGNENMILVMLNSPSRCLNF